MEIEVFKAFGEALAIGLLVGVERYRDRAPDDKKSAGVRTFSIFALLGAVCGLLEAQVFTGLVFAAVVFLLALGYYRQTKESYGSTTEMAGILTFWLGYLVHTHESLAISLGIVLVMLLAHKRSMHDFVRYKVSEVELYDTLKFLAVVFVVLPLLPDRTLGPYQIFNPRQMWMLVVLVSTISFSGYILIRVLGPRRGIMIGGIIGGIVSTTAVTMSLAERVRKTPQSGRLCGVVGVMANAVQFPRLLLLIWFVDPRLGMALMPPLLGMFGVGMLGAWLLLKIRKDVEYHEEMKITVQNPYSLWPALKFGAFFAAVFFVSKAVTATVGPGGFYIAGAIAGLEDVSAIALSAAQFTLSESLTLTGAALTILIAATANALFKWMLAYVNGSRELAFWLGGGFLTMLGTGWALMWVVILPR